jgi:hypothetical protein
MNRLQYIILRLAMVSVFMCLIAPSVQAQTSLGTTIRFSRANMKLNNVTLNGTFDFRFKLFDAPTGGTQIGPILTITNLNVSNGSLPTQSLDFGPDAFTGEARWVEVRARQGTAAFAPVGLRNKIFAVPYALALPGLRTQQNPDSPNIIGGFAGNFVDDGVSGATISGGGLADAVNSVTGSDGTVGGGSGNSAGSRATVAGGQGNAASAALSTVGGGQFNTASQVGSTVAGGQDNVASSFDAAVAGGNSNTASGSQSAVCGGSSNVASGAHATVAGGFDNRAQGSFSFVAGRRARALTVGSFVWADSSIDAVFFADGPNTFNVRAAGGARFLSNTALTTGVFLAPGSGTWANVSDRAVKSNIQPVDARDALNKVLALPISTWNYTSQDESIRHIGPMAQDFHAAFGVGESDKHITTIDADGVLFAAVQGLNQVILDKDAQISLQRQEISDLKLRMARLETLLETMRGSDRAKP